MFLAGLTAHLSSVLDVQDAAEEVSDELPLPTAEAAQKLRTQSKRFPLLRSTQCAASGRILAQHTRADRVAMV